MMVLMREAWPGQSTSVYCVRANPSSAEEERNRLRIEEESDEQTHNADDLLASCGGESQTNAENPKSSVMPRS